MIRTADHTELKLKVACGAVLICIAFAPTKLRANPVSDNLGPDMARKAERLDQAKNKPLSLEVKDPAATSQNGALRIVPIPMVNPTFGGGGALVAMYSFGSSSRRSTIGVAGGGAGNGSWLVGGGGTVHISDDRFRIAAFAGTGKLELKYFGQSPNSIFAENPVKFAGKGWAVNIKPEVRIAKSTYVGIVGLYMDATIETRLPIDALPDLKVPFRFYGLGPIVEYDTRNNGWWPTSGIHASAQWVKYHETSNISRIELKKSFDSFDVGLSGYLGISDDIVLAAKVRGAGAADNTPFFMKPSISFRGFVQGEQLDNNVLEAQGELRWMASRKWGFVAFAGAGSTSEKFGSVKHVSWAGGAGLRYRISEVDQTNVSADVARGNGNWSIYFSIGEAF